MAFHIFFSCLCHLIFFFPPLFTYYFTPSVWWDGAGGYQHFSSEQVEETSRISHLLWRWRLWPVTPGSELCRFTWLRRALQEDETHRRRTALTVKLHEAKELWSILRVNTDAVQARARLEREERLLHGANRHNCDCWLLHSWWDLASTCYFEVHKPSALMDISIRWKGSVVGS